MATITLEASDGSVETFECDEDTTILDGLEEAGLDHNYSCRAGSCSCLLYTSPSPRDRQKSRMPSSA